MPMRSARMRICCSLSSPDTYKTFDRFALSANWSINVDLPIPGSPPNKTMEPGTNPPPSTRFNSRSGIFIRCSFVSEISLTNCGLAARCVLCEIPDTFSSLLITSSTYVFHSPHEAHLPTHFGDCAPQFWQKKLVFVFVFDMRYEDKWFSILTLYLLFHNPFILVKHEKVIAGPAFFL